ncbi:MAG: M23 family metallopeptidase [Verrucomicrobia bacterium]|nr:M23 family metallopeptidase [Verrucomicrobiota bacterium]
MYSDFARTFCALKVWIFACSVGYAQTFVLPTANRALFDRGGEDRYFVGTVGKPWTSGTFGCVRSDGRQIHEGLDIKCLQHDRSGEPQDPIFATAHGTVVYINAKPSLSNYGRYLIVRHQIDGLEIYSVYAHLSEISNKLRAGSSVRQGETIAKMGRTSNTRQKISKDRAHLHFELNLFVNDKFPAWYKQNLPGQRNDHGAWNGRNLIGLDPKAILMDQQREGSNFSLRKHIQTQPELCRILVRGVSFPFLKRYAGLIRRNPLSEREGVRAYEIALNFNGLPIEIIPRAASEIGGLPTGNTVLKVNKVEQEKNPCRKLLILRGNRWELSTTGHQLIDLLTY